MGCDILVKIDSSVGKLAEGSSLLDLGGLLGILMILSVDASHLARTARTYSESAMFAVLIEGVDGRWCRRWLVSQDEDFRLFCAGTSGLGNHENLGTSDAHSAVTSTQSSYRKSTYLPHTRTLKTGLRFRLNRSPLSFISFSRKPSVRMRKYRSED